MIERAQQFKVSGGLSFREWASLFSGKIFVKAVIVYADESGTHDPEGKEQGSKYPVIAGLAAPVSEWDKFCVSWKAILDKYKVKYFHFREFAHAWACSKRGEPANGNPYSGWSLDKLENFLNTLAKVASSGKKVIVAGSIRISVFHDLKSEIALAYPEGNQKLIEYPYVYVVGEFFRYYHSSTFAMWGNFKCPVSFFFEDKNESIWKNAINEVYTTYKKHDSRIQELAFIPKTSKTHYPMQAADMYAYRIRQKVNSAQDGEYKGWNDLDKILFERLWKQRNKMLEIGSSDSETSQGA